MSLFQQAQPEIIVFRKRAAAITAQSNAIAAAVRQGVSRDRAFSSAGEMRFLAMGPESVHKLEEV